VRAARRPCAGRQGRAAAADFAGQPFISLAAVDPYRQQIGDAIFARAGVERRMALDTHSAASVCAMVREGVGLAIVNPLTALDYAGRACRSAASPCPCRSVNLVKPLHRPLPSRLGGPDEQALHAQADAVKGACCSSTALVERRRSAE
jgi:DNA-binding transcriptional LysR family regulator